VKIGTVAIGGANPCRFVAEIGNAHNGSFDRALHLIDAVVDAGADLVKFQCYTADELVQLRGDGPAPDPWGKQGWTMRKLYEKAQTPLEWFPRLVAHCDMIGVPWFSSVFGMTSLRTLEFLHCPAYKIARLDNKDGGLMVAVRETGKPVIVSTEANIFPADFNLYCAPGYPATFTWLPEKFTTGGFAGLSSHCLAPELPVAAVARGCKLIEMHVQLADEPSELEENVSLNQFQFKAMVESVKATEVICGF
jgi:N-acetylneuraminate synthase